MKQKFRFAELYRKNRTAVEKTLSAMWCGEARNESQKGYINQLTKLIPEVFAPKDAMPLVQCMNNYENVYPEHVEKVINSHQEVLTSIVFPVADPQFGQVLHATVERKAGSALTPEALKDWLRPRLSRSERPHQITVKPITVLETGKLARHHYSH
jgi:hypothetical protein